MANSLPDYIASSVRNPCSNRSAWYETILPSYAGIFLWVAFYSNLAGPTISQASLGVFFFGLVVAGLLCFGLYYYAPAMLGMQTGFPLYIVGTSMFGSTGGYLIPGLLMGVLQLGWFAVATSVATNFILKGLGNDSRILHTMIALVWAYGLAWIAIKGIAYVAKVAALLIWIPVVMIVIVFWANRSGIASYRSPQHHSWMGFVAVLEIVIGFFATAGAAGADFGMNSRNKADVVLGGLSGITLTIVLAGGLPVLSVAGHIARSTGVANYDYTAAITSVGSLAPTMFFLFAAASLVPTCFCCFIASNCFGTLLPKIPRRLSTLAGVTLSASLVITGFADNLVGFFQIVGASFGPICGAMAADYFLTGGKWLGPRRGINLAGYLSWAVGFAVGILNKLPGVPRSLAKINHPAVLHSFVVGFVVYLLMSKFGLQSARPTQDEMKSTT
jgi:cytosine permease